MRPGERRERTCFQVSGAGRPSGFFHVILRERPSMHSCATGVRRTGSSGTVYARGRPMAALAGGLDGSAW